MVRTARWIGLALDWVIATGVGYTVSLHQASRAGRDLDVYLAGARLLTDGDLYAYSTNRGLGFTYPPFAAVVFRPLEWLSREAGLQAARLVMVALLGAAMVVIVRCALRSVPAGSPDWLARTWVSPLVTGLASVSTVAVDGMHVLNLSLVLTAMVVLDHLGPVSPRWRGVLTGGAAAVKLTPFAFVLLFALTGRVREAARATAVFVAVTGACWLLYGNESTDYWTSALWKADRVGEVTSRANTALAGVWARAGHEQTALWVSCAAVVLAASYGVAVAYRRDRLVGVAVVGLMTASVPPLTWSHHWGWAVVAGVVVLAVWGPIWAVVWSAPFWALPWLRPVLSTQLPEPGWGRALLGGWPSIWFVALLVVLVVSSRNRCDPARSGPLALPHDHHPG